MRMWQERAFPVEMPHDRQAALTDSPAGQEVGLESGIAQSSPRLLQSSHTQRVELKQKTELAYCNGEERQNAEGTNARPWANTAFGIPITGITISSSFGQTWDRVSSSHQKRRYPRSKASETRTAFSLDAPRGG